MTPAYRYTATVHRVIDADTLELTIDLGFHVSLTIPIRIRGVDAPELRTPAGDAAKAAVVRWLEGQPIVVASYKDHQSFARYIGDIWIGDELLADKLKAAGYVK